MATVGDERWFYQTEAEWNAIAERLKQTACPHCRRVGTLNRHGSLYGYDETDARRKTLRARRIYCSNRHRRPGCGRTFSVWVATAIRRRSVTTRCLWDLLQRVRAGNLAAAVRAMRVPRSERTLQRLWQCFNLGQSRIRTALLGRRPPPETPSSHRPVVQVIAHLQAAFPESDPLAAFQHSIRTFFL